MSAHDIPQDSHARERLREQPTATHHGAAGKLISIETADVTIIAQIADGAHECEVHELLAAVHQAAKDQPTLLQEGNRYE